MDQKTIGEIVFPMELEEKQDLKPYGDRISYSKGFWKRGLYRIKYVGFISPN